MPGISLPLRCSQRGFWFIREDALPQSKRAALTKHVSLRNSFERSESLAVISVLASQKKRGVSLKNANTIPRTPSEKRTERRKNLQSDRLRRPCTAFPTGRISTGNLPLLVVPSVHICRYAPGRLTHFLTKRPSQAQTSQSSLTRLLK